MQIVLSFSINFSKSHVRLTVNKTYSAKKQLTARQPVTYFFMNLF